MTKVKGPIHIRQTYAPFLSLPANLQAIKDNLIARNRFVPSQLLTDYALAATDTGPFGQLGAICLEQSLNSQVP